MNIARIVKIIIVVCLALLSVALYFKELRPSHLLHRHHVVSPIAELSLRSLNRHPRPDEGTGQGDHQRTADTDNRVIKKGQEDRLEPNSPDDSKKKDGEREKRQQPDEGGSSAREVQVQNMQVKDATSSINKTQPQEPSDEIIIEPALGTELQPKPVHQDVFTAEMLKEAERDIQGRRKQVQRACANLGFGNITSGTGRDLTLPRALVSVNRASVYCPVEKTASTFFRRFVYQLEHTDPMRSPFEVPVKMIYACNSLFTRVEELAQNLKSKHNRQMKKYERIAKRRRKHNKLPPLPEPGETIDQFLRRSTNFLFVRDPFSRLFSAYVDKLLAPNSEFWDIWGLFAIQKHRADPSEKSQRCGHDATFPEFLKFVLDLDLSPPSADPHVRPIFDLCRPCDVDYSVVGFMNTFQRDVVYLSSLLNVTESQLEFHKMSVDTKRDALEDSVLGAFTEWSHRLAQCVTKGEIVRRIWRKLQIRGFISTKINFSPKLLRESVEFLDAEDFIKVLGKAVDASKDKEQLKKQKIAALIDAYRTVDMDTLKRIVHLYASDFRAFGFNERPKFIFERPGGEGSVSNYSAALDFMKPWKV